MRHRAALVECPETHFRVNLERPLLALRRHRVVHELDLRGNAPSLSAQLPSGPLSIDGARLLVSRRMHCGAAWRREHAAAARSLEQLPGGEVASSRTVEEPDGDVDTEANEIGWSVS